MPQNLKNSYVYSHALRASSPFRGGALRAMSAQNCMHTGALCTRTFTSDVAVRSIAGRIAHLQRQAHLRHHIHDQSTVMGYEPHVAMFGVHVWAGPGLQNTTGQCNGNGYAPRHNLQRQVVRGGCGPEAHNSCAAHHGWAAQLENFGGEKAFLAKK